MTVFPQGQKRYFYIKVLKKILENGRKDIKTDVKGGKRDKKMP